MTQDEIRQLVISQLAAIAPEADFGLLGDDDDLRETLDIDSMDFLNLVTALHAQTGIAIPEKDYARLATLGGMLDYLASH